MKIGWPADYFTSVDQIFQGALWSVVGGARVGRVHAARGRIVVVGRKSDQNWHPATKESACPFVRNGALQIGKSLRQSDVSRFDSNLGNL